MLISPTLLLLGLALTAAPTEVQTAHAASTEGKAARCSRATPVSAVEMLGQADAVVRARPVLVLPDTGWVRARTHPRPGRISFQVQEVLKGGAVADTLTFTGRAVERDDPNDHASPYRFVRPGGRSGNCVAEDYRLGAEYLLVLRRQDGELTPYWYALGPTNEQLRGPDDPWLAWVRQHLRATAPPQAAGAA